MREATTVYQAAAACLHANSLVMLAWLVPSTGTSCCMPSAMHRCHAWHQLRARARTAAAAARFVPEGCAGGSWRRALQAPGRPGGLGELPPAHPLAVWAGSARGPARMRRHGLIHCTRPFGSHACWKPGAQGMRRGARAWGLASPCAMLTRASRGSWRCVTNLPVSSATTIHWRSNVKPVVWAAEEASTSKPGEGCPLGYIATAAPQGGCTLAHAGLCATALLPAPQTVHLGATRARCWCCSLHCTCRLGERRRHLLGVAPLQRIHIQLRDSEHCGQHRSVAALRERWRRAAPGP